MSDKWLWVIGGGLLQIPLIEEARTLNLKILVTDMSSFCPARDLADRFEAVDIFDITANLNLCKQLIDENMAIAGVLAAGIDAPETMAKLNEYLGLKGVSSKVARQIQQKDLFRQAMQDKGYPVPRFAVVSETQEISSAIEKVKFPLIVKPPANSASRDMKIFSEKEIDECISFITDLLKKYDRILVEELWEGLEQTVECLVDINGEFHDGFITDRHFTFENNFPVETGLVHPTEIPKSLQVDLYALAKQLANDFDIAAGAVKLDTILTKNGPRIIEMTVRHSGGFDCQYLVPLSTGKNILLAAIYTAIQQRFPDELLSPRWKKFGVTGSVWPNPGTIESISGLDQAKASKGVKHIFLRYEQGDKIEPYDNCAKRVAFIICVADSRGGAIDCLQKAQATLDIKTV